MDVESYLKELNIEQLYHIRERSQELIQQHKEQSRIPVWSVVVGGIGCGDFVHYANAMACMSGEMEKNLVKIQNNKATKLKGVKFLKEFKSSIDLYFLTESKAEESCEDYEAKKNSE